MSAVPAPSGVRFEPSSAWAAEPEPPTPAELRGRLGRAGPGALDDAEALRLAAGLSEPAVRRLMETFGSLPEALAAPRPELTRCVGAAAAARLALAHDLARRLLEAPLRVRPVLSSWSAVVAYLRGVLGGLPREQFRVLFLDRRNRLIRG